MLPKELTKILVLPGTPKALTKDLPLEKCAGYTSSLIDNGRQSATIVPLKSGQKTQTVEITHKSPLFPFLSIPNRKTSPTPTNPKKANPPNPQPFQPKLLVRAVSHGVVIFTKATSVLLRSLWFVLSSSQSRDIKVHPWSFSMVMALSCRKLNSQTTRENRSHKNKGDFSGQIDWNQFFLDKNFCPVVFFWGYSWDTLDASGSCKRTVCWSLSIL